MHDYDPKDILKEMKAAADLTSKIEAAKQNIESLWKHRGDALIMLHSGDILSGRVVMATPTKIAFRKYDGTANIYVLTADVADFELH